MAKLFSLLILAYAALSSGCATTTGHTSGDIVDTDVAGKADATKEQRQKLIGTWYRKQPTKDGSTSEELTTMNADGIFVFQFRLGSEATTYFEYGYWGVSAGYHFTISMAKGVTQDRMQRLNPQDHENYYVYRVLELSDATFRYQGVATGNVFELHRVAPDFRLPQ